MIVSKNLKNGSVPFMGVKGAAEREAVMRLNENIVGLAEQVRELQTSLLTAQRELSGCLARLSALEAV